MNIVEGFDVSLFDKLIEVRNELDSRRPSCHSYWSKFELCEIRGPFLQSPGNFSGPVSIFLNVFSPITL